MKITACYCIFNETENIVRSLDSVRLCDRVVVLDGAWEQYPHTRMDGMSDDGTVEKVIQWMIGWEGEGFLVLPKIPWPNQRDKRSFYFRFGESGDCFLVIDGDEIVESGMEELRSWLGKIEVDAVRVREVVQKNPTNPNLSVVRYPGLSPRLIRFKSGLVYGRTYDKISGISSEISSDKLTMRHLRYDPIRSPERRRVKSENQTSEAFAAGITVGKADGRTAGTQVRLIHWCPNLRYWPDQANYESGLFSWNLGDDFPISPVVLHHVNRISSHSDIR